MLAEQGGDSALLFLGRIARVEHEDLEAGRQEGVVKGAQIVGEDAVGERGDDDADGAGARRGERARQPVGDVGELAHGALDHGAKVGETICGWLRAREAVTALTPARAATSARVARLCSLAVRTVHDGFPPSTPC